MLCYINHEKVTAELRKVEKSMSLLKREKKIKKPGNW